MEPIDRDDPIPVRNVCDTPEAILEALEGLSGWPEAVVVIEREGQPLGALISMNDLELFQRLLFDREMEQDLAALAKHGKERRDAIPIEQLMEIRSALRALDMSEGIPHAEVKRRFGPV